MLRTGHCWITLLAIAVIAVTAGPASASFSAPMSGDIVAGPALSGGPVLWLERRGSAVALVAADAAQPPRDVIVLPPSPTLRFSPGFALAASAGRATVERTGLGCRINFTCGEGDDDHERDELVAVDLLTGAATPLDGCGGVDACLHCDHTAETGGFEPRMSGSRVALSEACRRRARVVDLADGTVVSLPGRGELVAIERRANGGDHESSARFAVSRRDGSGRRAIDVGRLGSDSWAFDGAQLAWIAQPCAQRVVEVWDLTGDPPSPAQADCALPIVGATARYTGGRLSLSLSCPGAPQQGCAAHVRADARGTATNPRTVRLAAGTARTVRLRAAHPRRLRGLRRFSSRVTLAPAWSSTVHATRHRTVVVASD